MDMFFINNNKKSSEQSKAYYTLPAIFIRSRLKLLTFFTFSTVKKGEIKIQTKHKYIYRTNTKAKIGIFLQYIQIVCIALNKNLFERRHWHVRDCDHLLDADHVHGMFNTFCARF